MRKNPLHRNQVALYMNNREIFTSEERDENTERKRQLIELVASGEAILIVGAGSSVRVDYPDWSGLLKELETLASRWVDGFKPNEEKREKDPLVYAEDLKSYIGSATGNLERYYALLQNLFSPKNPPCEDFHRRLVSLPFRGILTTNYDAVLEAALGEIEPSSAYDNSLIIDHGSAGRVHDFLMLMNNDKRMTRRIAHLHGKFNPASSIILSIEDYERAYGLKLTSNQVQRDSEWTLHRKLLWAVLATRRAVFIGFSMEDPYFEKMLETVSNDLWRWDKSIHFAIMSISPESTENSKVEAERFNQKYGVGTVFYEDYDGSHLHLDHIVAEIAKECGVEIRSTVISQEQADDNNRAVDEEPKPILSKSADILVRLEEINQRVEKFMGRNIDDEN